MKNRVRDIDRGYREAISNLVDLDGEVVTLGVHGQDDELVDGEVRLVEIAAFHEFGTRRVPERSFLRRTVDAQSVRWGELSRRLVGRVVDRKMSARAAMALQGEVAAGDVKRTITELDEPPNAPSTIAQKGSANPLIDTGRLRGAIGYEVTST